ncbi:MAG: TetR/AcrR family transcriptional regulator [Anaerolineae bacterium]|nr:TetR/AcrR family transcriptional regulator [Anaerolineae bacterium]
MSDEHLILTPQHDPPRTQPGRADAVKNRELLLETAKRLFDAQSVEAVTMSAIAEAAGVGKGTLYRHFENKVELCQALLDEDSRAFQARTLDHLRGPDGAYQHLRWFLRETLEFVERNSQLLCVGTGGTSSLEHPAHWWWRQTIRGLLGQINPPGDLEYLADVLYVMLDVHTVYFQRQVRGYDLERIASGMAGMIERLAT